MKKIATEIPDVSILEPNVFEDSRGFFFESYNREALRACGITCDFIQDNHVKSGKGALRGLHYQLPPHGQAKLIRVIAGSIYDVAVDIRRESPTFGKKVGVYLDAKEKKTIFIPEGFAHGYLSLEEGTEVLYKVSSLYAPKHEAGIFWNDPALQIAWPKIESGYLLSEKDKKLPTLKEAFI